MLQLSVVGYPFVNPGPVGGVGTFKNEQAGKVEKILKGSLDNLEWPKLWRITMNSLHNEGIYE